MTMNCFLPQNRKLVALLAASLIGASYVAHSEERADLEQMHSTTLSLIDALVDSGVLSRQKADKLIRDAESKEKMRSAQAPGPEFKVRRAEAPTPESMAQAPGPEFKVRGAEAQTPAIIALPETIAPVPVAIAPVPVAIAPVPATITQAPATIAPVPAAIAPVPAAIAPVPATIAPVPATIAQAPATIAQAPATIPQAPAEIAQAPAPELGKDGKKIVRVPYVSEAVKREMREQIKQEVLAQAKTERWGEPGALPEWLDRIQFEGDVRLRYEMSRLDPANTAAGIDYSDGLFTRAPDIVGSIFTGSAPSFNTQENSSRMRLRARLGANAKLSDMVSAGISFSTGNTTNRVSTNQTLGQNFNKYSVVLDRGYLKLDPTSWMSLTGGRMRNPFFSTDLVWADDLNFEGAAVTFKPNLSSTVKPFLTAGYFPLRENSPGRTASRDLIGVQGGIDMPFGKAKNKFKLGAALYNYRGIEGEAETDQRLFAGAPDYVVRSEYADGFRQRGNSLFIINAPSDPNVNWGLASSFRELNVTGSLDLAQFDPVHVILTGDYVKNLAFKRDEIFSRTGFRIEDGKAHGYMGKIQVGHPAIARRGDWNVSLAYRYLGSDAVLDAFTHSDFGLGGTNNKGTIAGFNYGIDKNFWLSARWLSSDVIDPMVPRHSGSNPSTKLSIDTFQLDLNARF